MKNDSSGMDQLIESRGKEKLVQVKLSDKAKYYLDLWNIEHSWSGVVEDGVTINTFVMEAEQLLVNAIELFEMGYFDCAFYSLRSSIELSTTMVYLTDMPDDEKEQRLSAWKNNEFFPTASYMIKELSGSGDVFQEMRECMPVFFSDAKDVESELNKYVHKQGFMNFYVSRNNPINIDKDRYSFIQKFEYYLKKSIGIVAVMRLAADPFPVLLMDEEILYRCFDSMTEPYSKEFVDEYIGETTINDYKKTSLYSTAYELFINKEKKNQATFDVMKHQYIDTKRMNEIFSQLHLLPQDDIISVLLATSCKKIVKVYCYGGFRMYFTDRNTNRTKHSWSGLDFKNFAETKEKHNQPYDEAFISCFRFGAEDYFVEHNEPLTEEDIRLLESIPLSEN